MLQKTTYRSKGKDLCQKIEDEKKSKNLNSRRSHKVPVSPSQYKKDFLASEVAVEIREQLSQMEKDPIYVTESSYNPAYESGIPFSEKHIDYISTHPNVRPSDYMANLRLMTRLR